MPKTEIEILRTVTVTREENVIVELDIPKSVLDEGDVVSWIDDILEKDVDSLTPKQKAAHQAVSSAEWDLSDESEEIEYNEAYPAE